MNLIFKHLLIIFIFAIIAYLPSFHAPFVFDDIGGIVNNLKLKNISRVDRIWEISRTRFIPNLTFALNYRLSGLRVMNFHLISFLIHFSTAATLYLFTLRISKNSLIALFSAAVFALHPVQTQAVTYISQRSAVLAGLFYLLSLFFYLKSANNKKHLIPSLIFAAFAFISKENSFTLPFAILLTDIFFIKRDKILIKDRYILFSIYLILLIFVFALQTGLINSPQHSLAVVSRATSRQSSNITRREYLISQISVTGIYLKLLIFPVNQNFDYGLPQKIAFFDPRTIISLIPIFCLVFFAFLKKNKYPLLAFSVFFFFIALSVESSVFPIDDLIFEHRLYLPMVGFSLASGFCLYRFFTVNLFKRISKYIVMIIFITLSILTFNRNSVYRTEISLWQDTSAKSARKPRVRIALAAAYSKAGNFKEAISEYEKLLALDPGRRNLAFNNLGLIYLQLKNEEKAGQYFTQALAVNPEDPIARNNLANLHYSQNITDTALQEYQEILVLDPVNKEALRSLGYIYLNSGRLNEAISKFEEITRLPAAADVSYSELGDIYRSAGHLDNSVTAYRKALDLNTGNEGALTGLGKSYLLLGNSGQAKILFNRALKINPDNREAQTGISYTP